MNDRPGETTGWRRATSRRWTTRELLLVAVLAVVFGFLYLQWVPVWVSVQGLGAQVGQEALFGFWLAGGVLAGYIIRRPGAVILGETLAALAEILFGAVVGPTLLITGLVQGIGGELVFAGARYRNWSLPVVLLAGALTAVVALPWNWFRLGYFQLDPAFLVVLFVVRVLSGAVLGGLLPKAIGDMLTRTGVLSGYAIGRQSEQPRV